MGWWYNKVLELVLRIGLVMDVGRAGRFGGNVRGTVHCQYSKLNDKCWEIGQGTKGARISVI